MLTFGDCPKPPHCKNPEPSQVISYHTGLNIAQIGEDSCKILQCNHFRTCNTIRVKINCFEPIALGSTIHGSCVTTDPQFVMVLSICLPLHLDVMFIIEIS